MKFISINRNYRKIGTIVKYREEEEEESRDRAR